MMGGVLLALCFAPFDLADLVWAAPVCWLVAIWFGVGVRSSQRSKKPKRWGFVIGLVAGVSFWAINLKWLSTVTGAAYLVLAGYLAVYFALFGLFADTVGNPFRYKPEGRSGRYLALRSLGYAALNAGVWCGLEWLRGLLLTGFSWNGLGAAFHTCLPLAQGAELVGVTGLAFLPVFLAGVLVQVGVRLIASTKDGKMQRHWDFMAAVLILISCFSYGVVRMAMINRAPSDPLRVLLVQMNIPQLARKVLWSPEEVHEGYELETLAAFARVDAANERLIAEAQEAEGEVELEAIDWVVWPEVVLYGSVLNDGGESMTISKASEDTINRMRDGGVRNLMAGICEIEAERVDGQFVGKEEYTQYNALLSVNPEGELATHRKQHLVVYGEFIPFVETVKWMGDIYAKVTGVEWSGNLGRGERREGFTLPGANGEVRVIPSICFEDTVARVTRKFSQGEREVIVNITNDGWFGESEGSQQHFDNALFRAIELRRPMLRAANRGVTGVVSATGSLVDYETGQRQVLENEEGKPFQRGSILAKAHVLKNGGPTLYARAGDWFSVLGLGVGVGWCFWQRCLQRRRASGAVSD